MRSVLSLSLAVLMGSSLFALQAVAAENPLFVQPDSPYYVPGADPVAVGKTGDPNDAVAATEIGKFDPAPPSALTLLLLGYVLGKDAASSGTKSAPTSTYRTRQQGPSARAMLDLQLAGHDELENFIAGSYPQLAGKGVLNSRNTAYAPVVTRATPASPRRPQTAELKAWGAAFRAQSAPILSATHGVQGHPENCGTLKAAIAAAKIPHAPAPDLEQGAAAALGWYSSAAALCSRGKLEAMNGDLDTARQFVDAIQRELNP